MYKIERRFLSSERFLDPLGPPPPISFVHDEISKLVFIYYYLGFG